MNIEYREWGRLFITKVKKTTEVVYNELEVPRGECMIKLDDGTKGMGKCRDPVEISR